MIQYSSIKRFASLPSIKKLVATIINESRKTDRLLYGRWLHYYLLFQALKHSKVSKEKLEYRNKLNDK